MPVVRLDHLLTTPRLFGTPGRIPTALLSIQKASLLSLVPTRTCLDSLALTTITLTHDHFCRQSDDTVANNLRVVLSGNIHPSPKAPTMLQVHPPLPEFSSQRA